MPTIPSRADKEFEIPAPGSYSAVCYGVWDIGKQMTSYEGIEKIKHQAIISWEISETMKQEGKYNGKRFVVSNKYNMSLSEKSNLFKHLLGWLGAVDGNTLQGDDLDLLIGKPCMLSLIHNESKGKTYVNIASIAQLPKGMEALTPENKPDPHDWIKELQKKAIGSPAIQAADPMDSVDFDNLGDLEHAPADDEAPF